MNGQPSPFKDVYPCVGRCPNGVRCAPGCCFEQERIDAAKRKTSLAACGCLTGYDDDGRPVTLVKCV